MSVLVYEITPRFLCSKTYYEVHLKEKDRKWYSLSFPIKEYIGLFETMEQAKNAIETMKRGRTEVPYDS